MQHSRGSVLSQKDDTGNRRPRKAIQQDFDFQRKYSAGDLDIWAVTSGIPKWRTYLNAVRKVMNITDLYTLSWLRK